MDRHLARHLEWCVQRNLRPSYIIVRRRNIEALAIALGHAGSDATEEELTAWYKALKVEPGSRAFMLSHVQNYFRWLVHERIRPDDPSTRLMRPRLQRLLPRPISQDDLDMAIENAPDRTRLWLLLAAYAGLRACEIAALRAEDIRTDLEPPKLIVADGKGGKQRVISINQRIVVAMGDVDLAKKGYLFAEWVPTPPPRPHHVSHWCNAYLHGVGISDTLHQLRHRFGTSLYANTQDLRLTQEMMGHADPRTTAGYAGWNQDRASQAVLGL